MNKLKTYDVSIRFKSKENRVAFNVACAAEDMTQEQWIVSKLPH